MIDPFVAISVILVINSVSGSVVVEYLALSHYDLLTGHATQTTHTPSLGQDRTRLSTLPVITSIL